MSMQMTPKIIEPSIEPVRESVDTKNWQNQNMHYDSINQNQFVQAQLESTGQLNQ